ncbi:MAG: hypothetical protein JWR19_3754 [Pedosphaera sp.]|nr:hypothetical protein [Pedosphaera sp.]
MNLTGTHGTRRAPLLLALLAATLAGCSTAPHYALRQRTSFIALSDFSGFTRATNATPGQIVLTSPVINPPLAWNELIVSWNATGAPLRVEARGIYPNHPTRFYNLGSWSEDSTRYPRASASRQSDADGFVKIDTLILSHPGAAVQLRLTLGAPDSPTPAQLKFIGLSFCDTRAQLAPAAPNRAAWGRELPVPQLRQAEYAGGIGWCSPAALTMVLNYWSETLHRPELMRTVPEVADGVFDAGYGGTGNWPFNTAYAGKFPGLRAYVTRLNDLSEVEDWIVAGIPPILSVSSYLTNDQHSGPDNGHLIVCTGFTAQGDVIANNPGVSVKTNQPARQIYPRERVINAWQKSKNAVYLIYPETADLPPNRSGNWAPK